MADAKFNGDSLDELLDKLNSGDFVDQSVHEFSRTVDDTVKGYYQQSKGTSRRYTRDTYATTKPRVRPDVENAQYNSRYEQVTACLASIEYTGYASGKVDGYKQAVARYQNLVHEHKDDLRPVEAQVADDLATCAERMRTVTIDGYTQGYYDALQMVRKELTNSRLARLREISNRLK